ncbi:helix-turn-helix domain-containing protein [Gracilibacillus xinjiangensis]|uniref:Helix-turn-helix domain-containing protein n=1 Tax=Gracilibacillus xinjiangensis TaxID=1193282 RepID=A0ABV8WZE2_9BACI
MIEESFEKDIYSTKDLASFLQISEQTIYSLVKREEIVPINKQDWTIDGTYYFSSETAEKLKEYYTKPGLTNKDVAERLNVSLSTAQKLIKAGEIPSFTKTYLGREITFVDEEDLTVYESKYKKEQRTPLYVKETGTYLFQTFLHQATGEIARVVTIGREGRVIAITERGNYLNYDELNEQGYRPQYKLGYQKAINKRGYAIFQFIKPAHLHSVIYQLIEKLFLTVGVQNCKVRVEEEMIELLVKPIQLPFDQQINPEEIQLLKQSMIKGKVIERHQGILLDSDEVTIHTVIPSELKKRVQQIAKSKDIKIEEFVQLAITNYLKQMEKEDTR